jgi:transcriptional regulator of acetoin/glycerol metabolism
MKTYSKQETADMVGVCYELIRKAIARGVLACNDADGRIPEDIYNWLKELSERLEAGEYLRVKDACAIIGCDRTQLLRIMGPECIKIINPFGWEIYDAEEVKQRAELWRAYREDCMSIAQAAAELGVSRQEIYRRLQANQMKVSNPFGFSERIPREFINFKGGRP